MGTPQDLTLANAAFCFYERKWLEKYLLEFSLVLYRRYVDDIFVLFKSTNHLAKFCNYFNTWNLNFHLRKKNNGKMLFLDVEISWEYSKFVATVHRKPKFSGVILISRAFLRSAHKFCMLDTFILFYFYLFSKKQHWRIYKIKS